MSVDYVKTAFKNFRRWIERTLSWNQRARIRNGVEGDREDNKRPPPLDRPRKM